MKSERKLIKAVKGMKDGDVVLAEKIGDTLYLAKIHDLMDVFDSSTGDIKLLWLRLNNNYISHKEVTVSVGDFMGEWSRKEGTSMNLAYILDNYSRWHTASSSYENRQ
jgi:hypothetical protein